MNGDRATAPERPLGVTPETSPFPADRNARARRHLIVTLGLVAAALVVRKPDLFVRPQFWAEDGDIFYRQALLDGHAAVFQSYGGYLHATLRLVAALATAADPLYAPTVFLAACIALTLVVAAACFSRRIELPCPSCAALAIVLVPHTGEVFDNLTNLQWIIALGLVLLLLARDARGFWQWAADAGGALLLGLTGPFALLWLPLFWWRVVGRRTWASAALAGLVTVPAGIQLSMLIRHPAPQVAGVSAWTEWFREPCARLAGSLFLPGSWAEHAPLAVIIAFGTVCLGGMVWLAATTPARREQSWFLLGAALLIVAGTLYKFRGNLGELAPLGNGDRYFYLPKVLLLWLLAAELGGRGWRRWLAGVFLGLSVAVSAAHFRGVAYTDYHWPQYAARIRAGDAVTIPVNPPGWAFSLPPRRR